MTASWSANRTWVAGEIVTASLLNTYLRNNLDWLKTPVAAIDTVSGIATTSASLVDVTGSSVTYTATGTGGADIYWIGLLTGTATATITLALVLDGVTVLSLPFVYIFNTSSHNTSCSFSYHDSSLSAGSHTYKLQVSTNAGTATITGYLTYAVERGA